MLESLKPRTCSLDIYGISSQQFDTSLKLLLFLTKFDRANLAVCAFSDYNFAENKNNLLSPDFQDFRFLDVCLADELRKLMKMKMSAVKMLVASFLPLISIRLDTTHLLFSHSVSSFVCAPTSRPKSDLMDSKLQWTEIFPHLNFELPQPLNVTPYLAPPDALPFVWQARGHLVAAGWEGGWVEGGEGRWLQARGAGRGTGCKAAGKKTICD